MTDRNPNTPRRGSVTHRLSILVDRSAGPDACWPFDGPPNRGGYCVMQVDGKARQAHVWAFLDAGGILAPERPYVLHSCDNPPCCNPAHLRAGSGKDNAADRDGRGRNTYHRGETNAAAKLTEADVVDIRARTGPHGFVVGMAREYDVSVATIVHIRQGKVWGHVA